MRYRPEHKLKTRRQIIESARRLFNRKGFAEVSIDEVMENARLTRGGFYRHFKDKEELYAEAVRHFLNKGRTHHHAPMILLIQDVLLSPGKTSGSQHQG
jgi:AcrR family transcriptional regulator